MRLDRCRSLAYRPYYRIREHTRYLGTNIYTSVVIDPLCADSRWRTHPAASPTSRLRVEGRSRYDDAHPPLFTIINILNEGELDCIRCEAPASARGIVALSTTESTVTNQLSGKVSFPAGSILNFEARETTGDFTLAGYQARFSNVRGSSPSGGAITGEVTFDFPDYAATATVFNAALDMRNVALEEISQAFNVTNDRAGQVSGKIQLNGPLDERTIEHLAGEGHVTMQWRHPSHEDIRGLTDYLTRTVPGISLVDQSSGSMVSPSVAACYIPTICCRGNICISGRHLQHPTDKLDFTVHSIFKQRPSPPISR